MIIPYGDSDTFGEVWAVFGRGRTRLDLHFASFKFRSINNNVKIINSTLWDFDWIHLLPINFAYLASFFGWHVGLSITDCVITEFKSLIMLCFTSYGDDNLLLFYLLFCSVNMCLKSQSCFCKLVYVLFMIVLKDANHSFIDYLKIIIGHQLKFCFNSLTILRQTGIEILTPRSSLRHYWTKELN